MSWDSYVTSVVDGSKDASGQHHIDRVALCGKSGGAWTSSTTPNSLQITQDETIAIGKALSSKNFSEFQSHGVVVEGVKYQFLREEDGIRIMAKKKGNGGITIEATNQAFIVAHCPEGSQQGICNTAVNRVAQYLRDSNY